LSLRHIYFPLEDLSLRDDVGALGAIVGEVIQEQAGERVLGAIESARRAAIRRRQGDPDATDELTSVLADLEDVASFIRGYSVYFQVVNVAERVHRIRRRRDYYTPGAGPQPGGIQDAVQRLAGAGIGVSDLQELLDRVRLEPVFTAHPTEATRRTILEKHLRIARRLVERIDPTLSAPESGRIVARIRSEITALWQTEEHPDARRTVSDESEYVLFFLAEMLYRIVPPVHEALHEAMASVYGSEAKSVRVPPFLRFASWVGGDMDGNPNVTAQTVLDTLQRHRVTVISLYQRELEGLYHQLSQSEPQIGVSDAVRADIARYELQFPEAAARLPIRHAGMPYRRLIHLIRARLAATLSGQAKGYPEAEAFVRDIRTIADSLAENKGENAGLFLVNRLLTRARTFRFHLAALDVRQDSQVHREAVGRVLGHGDWAERPSEERTAVLLEALNTAEDPTLPADEAVERCLAVFRSVSRARAEIGPQAVGACIVSMTHGVDDILSVLALARWAGLGDGGTVPLDVVPLFETVGDLEAAADVCDALYAEPVYRKHLSARKDRQIVMVGYSDSGKDGGIAAARWALHRAQARILEVSERHGVDLTLFHGRGGTVSRGGVPIDRAVASSPRAYRAGRLRLTEQGEVINRRYGLRDVAERTVERMFAPVALAASGVLQDSEAPEWGAIGETIATQSRKAYRSLVYEDPRFYDYFRNATPIDVIERMQIGSRPPARRAQRGIQDLRAIPWVFAWTQSRHLLTGWYGVGTGLKAAVDAHGREALSDAVVNWPYLEGLLTDIESDLAAVDLDIARSYARLAGEDHADIFTQIAEEYDRTVSLILQLKGATGLLEDDTALRRSIQLRSPYIDPLSLLQVRLLRQWRDAGSEDDDLCGLLMATVNGIAQGIQSTG
jgi:phosphoenolpyruvate carboxylase